MTLAQAKSELNNLGLTIRSKDGEYRINFKGAKEESAYYTNDLDDAVNTGRAMTRNMPTINERARESFDAITEASYYGMEFRQLLRDNPVALRAAETLANAVRESETFRRIKAQ